MKDEKLLKSIKALEQALTFKQKISEEPIYFAGIAKSFEVCLEYAWKYFKRSAIEEGLEVFTPKESIKHAGRLELIDSVEKWLGFLRDRNLAVHDYLGMPDHEYLRVIEEFMVEVKKIKM